MHKVRCSVMTAELILNRFEKWGGCNYEHEDRPVPCMLGDKDTAEFERTECLFARKFVYNQLPQIVSTIIYYSC